ncbi:MAG: hypothetical protein K2Q09_09285, partial [Phycisphaerales bacterium]|nr:hypothetical protein [Phycisphaerales bacterium]
MFNRRPELFLTAAATLCAPAALCAQSPSQADTSTHKAPAVSATEPAPPALDTAAGDRWAVRIEPQVWFVGAAGNLQMPGSPAGTPDVKLRSIGADDPEASPAARLTI